MWSTHHMSPSKQRIFFGWRQKRCRTESPSFKARAWMTLAVLRWRGQHDKKCHWFRSWERILADSQKEIKTSAPKHQDLSSVYKQKSLSLFQGPPDKRPSWPTPCLFVFRVTRWEHWNTWPMNLVSFFYSPSWCIHRSTECALVKPP